MNRLLPFGTVIFVLSAHLAAAASPTVAYTQGAREQGILIKAPASVDRKAIEAARKIVAEMLRNCRPDIRQRLVMRNAALAIVPKDRYVTALPEFARLSGKKDRNGNEYDAFKVRGLGGVLGQPVSATSEEGVLKLEKDPLKGMSVTHHEFGHAVMNIGFSEFDHAAWKTIYENAVRKKVFDKSSHSARFALGHPDEYWAVLTTAYFSVNWKDLNGPEIVQKNDPDAYRFLRSVFGSLPKQTKVVGKTKLKK